MFEEEKNNMNENVNENNIVEDSEDVYEESYDEDEEDILISSDYIKEKINEVVDKYVKINPSLQETLNLLRDDLIREIELVEESYEDFEDEEDFESNDLEE